MFSILAAFPDETFSLASEIHLMCSSKVSLRLKFRVCVRHGAVFCAAVSVDAVVWILVNTQSRFSDPLDNLLLSAVSNEAENQKKQEEEEDDCYRCNHCYHNIIVKFKNSGLAWLRF